MKTKKCVICNKEFDKEIKRINKEWICSKCYIQKKKNHREYLKREVLGIKKRSLGKIKEQPKPEIKKQKSSEIKSIKINNYFTITEKQFLFRKYYKKGLSKEEIIIRVNKDKEYLDNFVKDLMKQEKQKEEISKKFREEFSKLIC
jgi:hypothetical protein